MNFNNYDSFKNVLREKLDDYRYNHCICVADKARELALKYGADENKAYLAGLLHDITKNLPPEEHLKIFERFGIILTDVEKNARKLWHGISGAAYVKGCLFVDDPEIYDAIRYHTTAKANMSLLTEIIYIADFISADRTYKDVDVMRSLADISLDKAVKYSLCYMIGDLIKKGVSLHPDSVAAYNELCLKGVTV